MKLGMNIVLGLAALVGLSLAAREMLLKKDFVAGIRNSRCGSWLS